jgi:hypothetical protein
MVREEESKNVKDYGGKDILLFISSIYGKESKG